MQDRLVVNFELLKSPRAKPEADTEPDVSVSLTPSSGFADTVPPPILEHIMSQLLDVCESPGAVRIYQYLL